MATSSHSDHCCHGPHGGRKPVDGRYDRVPAGYAVYTCPMHPEVRGIRASACPLCGMALEPAGVPRGPEDTTELEDMTRRFRISSALTAPLLISPDALERLRRAGVEVVMLTGDSAATARAVARRLGIERVHADASPEHKYRIGGELQASGRVVAMAGDGINDAPALARADVGIAMGTGTDVAMESAGVSLVRGTCAASRRLGSRVGSPCATSARTCSWPSSTTPSACPSPPGVLYPWLGVLLSPMVAAAAMSLSSVSVIANALRLRRVAI